MKLYKEIEFDLKNFKIWGGATYRKEKIIYEGKEQEFNQYIEDWAEQYDGLEDIQINDFLWFEEDLIAEILGLEEEWDLI